MSAFRIDSGSLGLLGDDNWLSIVSLFDISGAREIRFLAEESITLPQDRLNRYINYLHSKYIGPYLRCYDRELPNFVFRQIFQGEDCPRNIKSVSWESQREWTSICLIPDLYYFLDRGHERFLPDGSILPTWSDRLPVVVWRGSTTGVVEDAEIHRVGFNSETLSQLPRYRLCHILRELGPNADAGIVSIVQCPDEERHLIVDRLNNEGLVSEYIKLEKMSNYKYIVDIDGNTNSWNFIERLRLGCCVLKVESPWIQWFDSRLKPWVHYVPIRRDLKDLLEKVEWCRTHDRAAAEIAQNGRQFGLNMHFETEMRQAALDILRTSCPISPDLDAQAVLQEVCAASDRLQPSWDTAIATWSSFPVSSWLQTAHGSILGRGPDGEVTQLEADGDMSAAIVLHDAINWKEQLIGYHIDRHGNRVTFERAGLFLSAQDDCRTMVCDRLVGGEWETFSLVPTW